MLQLRLHFVDRNTRNSAFEIRCTSMAHLGMFMTKYVNEISIENCPVSKYSRAHYINTKCFRLVDK